MKDMKKYIKVRSWGGRSYTTKRMVNQPEIVDYLKNNPLRSENEIMYDLYGFYRGGIESNKKYADCLRRALDSGKIVRVEINNVNHKSRYFYFVPEPKQEHTFMEWLTKG